ncbi:MAG: hypothetical protein MUF63_05415 [Rhodobacteraceae bacterium]|jgi:hypothetical protein|nr:hypothetical protein [Paracoccaceae bacterium]
MARSDRDLPREDDGPRGAARFLARPLLLAVIVFLLVVAFTWFLSGRSDTMLPAEVQPSGAGTEPKGVVERDTGSTSQPVDAGEVIDNSSRSDNRPNILDAGEGPTPSQD